MSQVFRRKATSSNSPFVFNGQVLLAEQPWLSSVGQCVALRVTRGSFEVAVEKDGGRCEWYPAPAILSESDAAAWVRSTSFRKLP